MPIQSSIEFVYFDVGDVVVDNRAAKRRISRDFGIPYEKVVGYLDATWEPACRGELTGVDRMSEMARTLGFVSGYQDFNDFWSYYLTPIISTHRLIIQLSQRYRVGILSNAELGMIETILKNGKIPAVDWSVVIESAQVRCIKPEPAIYTIAQQRTGVTAQKIFLTDDNPKNIDAAKRLGWSAFLFDAQNPEKSCAGLGTILGL